MKRNLIELEVIFKAVRSGGPGGQHVNRTASAAVLYWNFEDSRALNEEEKALVRKKLKNRINKDGRVYLRCEKHRDLDRNKSDCLEKLLQVVVESLKRPKKRQKTKPTKASKEKRLKQKSQRSETKKSRQKPDYQ